MIRFNTIHQEARRSYFPRIASCRTFLRQAILMFTAGILFLAASAAVRSEPVDGGVPADRVQFWARYLPKEPRGVGSPASERAIWEALAKHEEFSGIVKDAERELRTPIPDLPDELYLDFSRTGNRRRYERPYGARRTRLAILAVAECLENRGRFIPEIEKLIAALAAEKTWVMPAHDGRLDNFHGRTVEIDLGSSGTAWNLATVDFWLADKLSPKTRQLIAQQLEQRIFTPFEKAVNTGNPRLWWLTGTNNWNAVCLANVVGAALENIQDSHRRAFFVAAAEKYIQYFLQGFTPDGYCSEGIGYWNYGFGHFTLLGETLYQATGGHLDLFADPKILPIALFGFRMEIAPGLYPAFADCHFGARPDPVLMAYLSRRYDLGLIELERRYTGPGAGFSSFLPEVAVFAMPNSLQQRPTTAEAPRRHDLRDWFADAGILIARPADLSPDKLAVALKGGHNAEHHNHNDVGSFVVTLAGGVPLVDPGAEVYTARTFSSRRYESRVLNSYGHPVPVVAGQLQRPGSDARAKIIETQFTEQSDILKMDMSSAYAVKQLERLVRTFVYERTGRGRLTVRDEVAFSSPQEFEEALITYSPWKRTEQGWIVGEGRQAVRVRIVPVSGNLLWHEEQINEDVTYAKKPVRLAAKLNEPVKEVSVEIVIEPVENE
ncbi:hypothetical protein [Thermogutta sp.]|uniref:hypothetical protein n=1 Tax=Thermogutta sp. TaxID=1962930 RepID=UPI003C7C4A5A